MEDFMVCFQNLLNQFDKEETLINFVTINLRLVKNAMKCKPTNVAIIKEVKQMFVIDSFYNQVKRVKLV